MKKILFTLASALLTFGFGFSQTTEIPDRNFEQALIDLGYDSGDPDGFVLTTNINLITELNVSNKSITDLTGIEGFTDLTSLDCYSNELTSLDVSNNTALTSLYCYGNQLTSLDVSNNTALTILYCYSNELTSLDVSNNTALDWLYCYGNKLTSLAVSNNTALTSLICGSNQLTSLDVSNNTALTILYYYGNKLTSLDVSNNTALTSLSCYNNQLTSLDVSNNTALTYLHCYNNQLTILDVSNNTALTNLSCSNNQLTSLDVSNNTALTRLYCANALTSLDVRNGNNINFINFDSTSNPNLTCIFVDDVDWSSENWTGFIDSASTFVANEAECSALSVVDYASYLDIFIHPNPTENHLFVQGHKNPISISISNLQGKKVLSKINVDKIDVSELSNGVYFIKISDGINSSTKKFIKN